MPQYDNRNNPDLETTALQDTTDPTVHKAPPPSYHTDTDLSSTQSRIDDYQEPDDETLSEISDDDYTVDDLENEELRFRKIHGDITGDRLRNIIRGAKENGDGIDLSECDDLLVLRAAVAEAEIEGVHFEGWTPDEKDMLKIRREVNLRNTRREEELPHYDGKREWDDDAGYSYFPSENNRDDITSLKAHVDPQKYSDGKLSDHMRGKALRGETDVVATGSQFHRSRLWLHGTLENLNVHNYIPDEDDLQELEELCADRGKPMPLIYKDPPVPEKPEREGQTYKYNGDSEELQKVCEKANEQLHDILHNQEFNSDDEFNQALNNLDEQFLQDFQDAIPVARVQAQRKIQEGYLKQRLPTNDNGRTELEQKHHNERLDLEERLQDIPEEEHQSLRDDLKVQQQAEVEKEYQRVLFNDQDGQYNNEVEVDWGKGLNKDEFENALSSQNFTFTQGTFPWSKVGFQHINADDGDKRKPAIRKRRGPLSSNVYVFEEKPPKERTIKAFAKAAIAGGSTSVKLKGSEDYKQQMWKACKLEAALKGVNFHVDGYTPSPEDLKDLEEAIKKARDAKKPSKQVSIEASDEKTKLSIEAEGDKKEPALKNPEPSEEAERPAPARQPSRPVSAAPTVSGPRGPARVNAPNPNGPPPSIKDRINAPRPNSIAGGPPRPSGPPRVQSDPSESNSVPSRRHSISGPPPVPKRESVQEIETKHVSPPPEARISQRPQSMAPSPELMESAEGYAMTHGKQSPSVSQALSRNNAERSNLPQEERAAHRSSTAAEISESKIGSRPSTPIPKREVEEGERYYFVVKEVITEGDKRGAIIQMAGAQQREDQAHKRSFFVPESKGGCALQVGERKGQSFAHNIDFVQSQNLNQGQKTPPGSNRNSLARKNSRGGPG